jgi:hypothetical protein
MVGPGGSMPGSDRRGLAVTVSIDAAQVCANDDYHTLTLLPSAATE